MKPLVAAVALTAALVSFHSHGQTPEAAPQSPPPDKPPASLRENVDALSEADLARVLPLLRENFLAPEKLTELEVDRATVQGLVSRLAPGASILPAPVAPASAPQASPFRCEQLPNHVAYIRLGDLSADNLGALDAALQPEQPYTAVILDLRPTPPGSQFDAAAAVCNRFCPKGKVLFTLKRPNAKDERLITSKTDPRFQGVLAILVGRKTAGAAEVIAAVLRTHAKAMIIGQTTKGEAAEFSEVPLPSGKILRIAVGEVALPENVSVFPGGIKPELLVRMPQETTDALLKLGLEKGVKALVTDVERPRMNEAALVAGNNPELEAYQAAQRNRGEKPAETPVDTVVQRALDFITALGVYQAKPPEPAAAAK